MIGPPSYPTKTSPGEGLVRFLSVRLIVSLIIAVAGVSLLFSYHQVAVEQRGLKRDLSKRAEVLAERLKDSVEPLLAKKSHKPLQRIVDRFGNRYQLPGVAFIVLITLVIIRLSVEGPIAKTAQWIRSLRTGISVPRPEHTDLELFRPLTKEVSNLAASLEAARAAAEQEAQLREAGESQWT